MRRLLVWQICILLAAGLISQGCGKKGDPIPPRQIPPAAVSDLSGVVSGDTLVLNWSIPEPSKSGSQAPAGFEIYCAKTPVTEAACAECALPFETLARVDISRAARAKKKMEFRETLEPGYNYAYKVRPYTRLGLLGDDSETIRVQR